MDLEPTPTSPKAKNSRELDALYKDKELALLHRPAPPSGRAFTILLAVIFGVFAGFFGGWYFSMMQSQSSIFSGGISVRSGSGQANAQKLRDVTEQVRGSLVGIFEKKDTSSVTDPLASAYPIWEKTSTGLIVTADGWLVAPRPATPDLKKSYVAVTADRQVLDIQKILADPASDQYFLKVAGRNLPVPEFADAKTYADTGTVWYAQFGSPAAAGPGDTVEDVMYQPASSIDDLIQSGDDIETRVRVRTRFAAADQGTVAVTETGKIVGVLAGAAWPASDFIPAPVLQTGLNSLLKNGEVVRPFMGFYYIDLTGVASLSSIFTQGSATGALITGDRSQDKPAILPGGPAEKAGLKKNDVIVRLDKQPISRAEPLNLLLQQHNPGDTVTLTVLRDNTEQDLTLTLGSQK